MVTTRVASYNRISIEDGAAVDIVVSFPGEREDAYISTDSVGAVKGCEHFDQNMIQLSITQTETNQLRVEILDEETEEGEHDMVLKYLRAIFHEQKADE